MIIARKWWRGRNITESECLTTRGAVTISGRVNYDLVARYIAQNSIDEFERTVRAARHFEFLRRMNCRANT